MSRLFIAPTPRTGNTWLRKLVADSLSIVERAAHTIDQISWQDLPAACVIAIHVHATPGFRQLLDEKGFRILVTVRHPFDVLLSILQHSQYANTARWLSGEAGDESILARATPLEPAFLEYALSKRAEALLGLSPEWMPFAAAVVRYESLVWETRAYLGKTLKELGLSPVRRLQHVVEGNTLENLRLNNAAHSTHFWRGEPGLWRKLLPGDVAEPIAARHHAIFERLGYRCDYDPGLTRKQARENWEKLFAPDQQMAPSAGKRGWFSFFKGKTG